MTKNGLLAAHGGQKERHAMNKNNHKIKSLGSYVTFNVKCESTQQRK